MRINRDFIFVVIALTITFILLQLIGIPHNTNATVTSEFKLTQNQIRLCELYGAKYNICPQFLQAFIEEVNTDETFTTNTNRYGLCRLNGSIYGTSFTTDEEQINIVCIIFLAYECEPDLALSIYAEQSEYTYYGFIENIFTRTMELESEKINKCTN